MLPIANHYPGAGRQQKDISKNQPEVIGRFIRVIRAKAAAVDV